MNEQTPTITVSLERKIKVDPFGSAGAFVCLQNVPIGATPAEIKEMLATANLAWDCMVPELRHRLKTKIDAIV